MSFNRIRYMKAVQMQKCCLASSFVLCVAAVCLREHRAAYSCRNGPPNKTQTLSASPCVYVRDGGGGAQVTEGDRAGYAHPPRDKYDSHPTIFAVIGCELVQHSCRFQLRALHPHFAQEPDGLPQVKCTQGAQRQTIS
jgi:hypothetical protein